MTEHPIDDARKIEVFAAACSGSRELAREIGLPVACVRAARDVDADIEAMNQAQHGGWVLWPDGFQPFRLEEGWCDWRVVELGGAGSLRNDLRYEKGRFVFELPVHVTAVQFERALRAEFRRFAVAEIATTPRWLIAQCDARRPFLVLPRYALNDPNDFRASARRVDDLCVIHPVLHVPTIADAILSAKTSATRDADEALRHV